MIALLNGTYNNIEYICVIDGGSTDGTVDIIKQYQKYIRNGLVNLIMVYIIMSMNKMILNG